MDKFDLIILTTAADMRRTMRLYYKHIQMLNIKKIIVIGNDEVRELVDEISNPGIIWMDEESLIAFEDVKYVIESIYPGVQIGRGFIGWYYQQFLKMEYSRQCNDKWYLCWDGDTVPVKQIEMFSEKGQPFLDWKREYYPSYFRTLSAIFPGMKKTVEMSFISEHMLFSKDIMLEMINEIENADHLIGKRFFERILRAADKADLNGQGFSEFETYGTYIAYRYPQLYRMRRWCSWRNCGQYFDVNDITEEEMNWIGEGFQAVSFEKGHMPIPEAAFIRDPKYREKIRARQMVEIIQEMSEGGMKESWD